MAFNYKIHWKKSATKELTSLNIKEIPKIVKSVSLLSQNPFPNGVAKLKESNYLYRIRVGDYRIIYSVDTDNKQVIIEHIRHRSAAYKN